MLSIAFLQGHLMVLRVSGLLYLLSFTPSIALCILRLSLHQILTQDFCGSKLGCHPNDESLLFLPSLCDASVVSLIKVPSRWPFLKIKLNTPVFMPL
jgi:hypothetical protein